MLARVPVALPLAVFNGSIEPFIALLALGFLVGVIGHITKSRTAVAIGVGLIFLTTVLLPLLLFGNPY
jgi:hypothetical protein